MLDQVHFSFKGHLAGRTVQHGPTTPLGLPGTDWGGDPPPWPGMRERESAFQLQETVLMSDEICFTCELFECTFYVTFNTVFNSCVQHFVWQAFTVVHRAVSEHRSVRWNWLTAVLIIDCWDQWLFIYSWTGSILASAYSRRGTARPILSSRDFRQASSVLQPKAFYF